MSFGFSISDFLAVIELVNKSRKSWVDAPVEYKALVDETRTLSNILQDLEDVVTQIDLTSRQQDDLEQCRLTCVAILDDLKKLENKYIDLNSATPGFRARAKKAWKRSKLEPEDIRALRLRMSSSVISLTAVLNSASLLIASQTYEEIVQLNETHQDSEKIIVANWFATATFAEQHTDLISRRTPGTGQWLLDSPKFAQWVACQNPRLLCPGIPGSGKTMIASTVIDHLQTRFRGDESVAIVYYYFDYALQSEQQLIHVLSSCIRQLIQVQSSTPTAAKLLYDEHKDRQTRVSKAEDLWALLANLSGLHSRVYLVIDALDECRNDDLTHDNLISGLVAQQLQAHTKLQILFTCRPIQQIIVKLPQVDQLEIRASSEDVRRYLDTQMPRLSCVARRTDLQETIKNTIGQVADGMFLLVKLHFDSLTTCTKPRDVRRILGSLPRGNEALTKAYQSARDRIDGQPEMHRKLAHKVLTFVTYTERVLTIVELQHALAIEAGMKEIDPDEDLDEESLLVSLCAGLVTIDPESRHVRFVHYTTSEYIETIRDDWLPHGRISIFRSCVAYLCIDELRFGAWENYEQKYRRFPFLDHAAYHWGDYARHPQEHDILNEVYDFLLDEGALTFASLAMQLSRYDEGSYSSFPYRAVANLSPLHITAIFGLVESAQQLIRLNWNINPVDSKGDTPLHWAVKKDQLQMMKIFLAHPDTDVNTANKVGETALYIAAAHGDSEIVQALLAHPDTDVNATDKLGETALHIAATHDHIEIVQALLAHPDTDVNAANETGDTALHLTAFYGFPHVMQVLLAHPYIDIEKTEQNGRTALHVAVDCGPIELVELLLARSEIDTEALDDGGDTALSIATSWGYTEIVEILEKHSLNHSE